MKMVIVTGSYPPDVCGVSDYTSKLMETMAAKDWCVYTDSDWSLGSLLRHIRNINSKQCTNINLQYPTQGYGWSLVPHLLTVYYSWFTRKKFSVTIHEQMQLSLKAYIAELIMMATANKIIFTNQFERQFAIKRMPWIERRSEIIKIFSNIVAPSRQKPIGERTIDILYFGLIIPRKGIEKFITATRNISDNYKVMMVGKISKNSARYAEEIMQVASDAGIEIRTNLEDEDVSAVLGDTRVAYLPFPDGASERRGSLLAAMTNGAVVASTTGKYTTPELANAIIDISKIPITEMLADNELLIRKQKETEAFLGTQMPHSWEDVAKSYDDFLFV
jgi:glycosyltransferase involved in cell wall biosynthesis